MARKSRYCDLASEPIRNQRVFHAGLYIRLSVEDEDNVEKNSISNQKKIGLHFLKEKSDIVFEKNYIDNGYTGMNYDRPAFGEMMTDLEAGNINCVIVKDISRLGRHFLQTSEFVEKIFPQMGVRLICINDGYDSTDGKSDTSQLMLPIKMVMNDSYAKDISKKIRSSITAKVEAGEYLPSAGSVPYGYFRNPEENTFDIDPEAAEVVERIYGLRAEKMKYNTIARILNTENIPSPGKLRYIRKMTVNPKYKEAEWSRKTIRKICEDQVYIGNRVHGRVKRDKLGANKTRRAESEWTIIQSAHPRIIPEDLYKAVQAVNEQEKIQEMKKVKRAGMSLDFRDVLRGKVVCGDCKSEMLPGKGCARQNARTSSRVFYDCKQYKNSQHRRCSSHYIRQEALMGSVENVLNKQINVVEDLQQLLDEVKRIPIVSEYQLYLQKNLLSVQKQRKSMEEREERMLIDLMEGVIDRDMYEYAKQQYAEKVEQLLLREKEMSDRSGEWKSTLCTAEKWVMAMKEYQKLPEMNRKLMEELVDYIEVFSDREIMVHLNYQDPLLDVQKHMKEITEVMTNAG